MQTKDGINWGLSEHITKDKHTLEKYVRDTLPHLNSWRPRWLAKLESFDLLPPRFTVLVRLPQASSMRRLFCFATNLCTLPIGLLLQLLLIPRVLSRGGDLRIFQNHICSGRDVMISWPSRWRSKGWCLPSTHLLSRSKTFSKLARTVSNLRFHFFARLRVWG